MNTYYCFVGEQHAAAIESMLDIAAAAGETGARRIRVGGVPAYMEAEVALTAFAQEDGDPTDLLVLISRSVMAPHDTLERIGGWGAGCPVVSALSHMAHEPYAPLLWRGDAHGQLTIPYELNEYGVEPCIYAASDVIGFRRSIVKALVAYPGLTLMQVEPPKEDNYLPAELRLGEKLAQLHVTWYVDTSLQAQRLATIGTHRETARWYSENNPNEVV